MPTPTLFGSVIRITESGGSPATGDQVYPHIAALPNGRLVMAWNTLNGHEISFFRASGVEAGAHLTSFAVTNGTQAALNSQIDVVALSDGRVVAAWSNNTADAGEVQWQYVSEDDGAGALNTIARAGFQGQVSLAAGINGRFVIVGAADGTDGTDAARIQGFSTLGGNIPGTATSYGDLAQGSGIAGAQHQPNAATLADGRIITAWVDALDGSIKAAFLGTTLGRLTSNAISLTAAGQSPTNTTEQYDLVGLTGLANGGFFMTYQNGGDVFYRFFDSSGAPTTALLNISPSNNALYDSDAVALGDGRVMLAYSESLVIKVQMVNADGTLDGAVLTVGAGYLPQLALLADGRVAVAYTVSGTGFDSRFQIIDPRTGPITVIGQATDDEFYGTQYGDVMIGAAGGDLLDGRDGDDGLYGGDGADQLYGGVGADYLSDNNGADYSSGGDGNDVFYSIGGFGVDTLLGGNNDDQFYVESGDIVVESVGGGTDRIFAASSFSLGAGVEIETLSTDNNGGTVAINLTGNELANVIIGNNGANVLDGRGGNDTIYALDGADSIYFSTAPDGSTNMDTIVGFNSVDDTFFLDDALFTGIPAGFLTADAFASGPGMTTAGAGVRIFYNTTTGDLYWDPDGNGAAAAVRFAQITPVNSVAHFDFFIY
jgi:Ca2+-binding RTX toxin-like protein